MAKRMVCIWFPHLITDWMIRHQPELKEKPFALAMHERNKRIIKATNAMAQQQGVHLNIAVADCKAIVPELQVFDFLPEQSSKLLNALAEWFIRYSPLVAVDAPDGLIIDASGCTHLWGDECGYLNDIQNRMKQFGYSCRIAISDTIGASWAVSRYGKDTSVISSGLQSASLSELVPQALRLNQSILERLNKLGFKTIGSFMQLPATALRRRFGQELITRLNQALGGELEMREYIMPIPPYQERLPSLEPIRTDKGIEIALKELLNELCQRLNKESKGLRKCELRCYRMDGIVQKIETGTNKPSRNVSHLFKLFEIKIAQIDPGLGIELFVLEATVVEELQNTQDALWAVSSQNETAIAELLDRLTIKTGANSVHRYLPDEHYWPERSVKESKSLNEKATTEWRTDLPRPMNILKYPELIDVTVPIPDYPPIMFRYRGIMHKVRKADGPERIEQEWWIQSGLYRDYYCVEDEQGSRYWLFRSGDYYTGNPKWFIHGFFA